jgi:hypothetical protein
LPQRILRGVRDHPLRWVQPSGVHAARLAYARLSGCDCFSFRTRRVGAALHRREVEARGSEPVEEGLALSDQERNVGVIGPERKELGQEARELIRGAASIRTETNGLLGTKDRAEVRRDRCRAVRS